MVLLKLKDKVKIKYKLVNLLILLLLQNIIITIKKNYYFQKILMNL